MIPTFALANSLSASQSAGGGGGGGGGGHRYWRITNIDLNGGAYLEISEVSLLVGGSEVDSIATKTPTVGETVGPYSNLFDGNLSSRAYWPAETVEVGTSFALKWDFGAGNEQDVDGAKQGGHDTADRYMYGFDVQWSDDDSSWTTAGSFTGLTYPGNHTLSSLYSF